MEVALRDARRPQAEAPERGTPDALWGVRGIMDKDILPDGPTERRRRSRLCALRAMDRLGLLGEENLIATLAGRPQLRWLADEGGARWAVLAELGRIGDRDAFEAAVEWTLENRPRSEQVRAYLCRFRPGAIRLPADAGRAGRSLFTQGVASGPHPRGATGKEERRRC